ncbi:RagB/SusD family nutrient uptake outer membrane protein [Sphingobacterium deserti]|uniref:RagB/SusD domain-containing protein n=1 Tax=Sphingobacterium deserti TaxID=1229276 RepID=A0A0B8T6I5_9SPHI|nr:RagB/SusD family nutrient uptake outer membrane protein [Sphingobacterium deserti]KGE13664.1 RagB/SusD domain-containing protein [Sphingobacterium deserti]
MNTLYKFIALVLTGASLSSCNSFLDRQPLAQVTTDSYFNSETNANAAVTGMYRTMTPSFGWGQTVITLPEFSARHIAHISSFPEYENFATHNVTVINPWTSNVWNSMYTTINAANNIIARVPNIPEDAISAGKRNQFIGEGKFIRALSYFFMVRAFGRVPLKLTATTEDENQAIPQSEPQAIYEQIVLDLTEAAEALPEAHANTEATKGRATKAAAQALLAKVYLYQAKYTNDYAKAAAAAKLIIDSDAFQLVTDYGSIWRTENTAESIFELQFDNQLPNTLASVSNNNPSMLFYIRDTTIGQLFDTTDIRRSFSVVPGIRVSSSGDTTSLDFMGKFPNFNPASQNLPIIRLAELYLIHAEAEARASGAVTASAFASLNAVLTRASVSRDMSEFTSVDSFVRFVQEEKEREMLFEGETWFDFCRTGLALEKYSTLRSEQYFVYPIPAAQLSLNGGLVQNPGYN